MPIMLAVFAPLHLKWRTIVILLCVTTVFGGPGLGNIASVAPEGGNRSILLRKADIGDGRRHVSFVPRANLLPVIWT
jgi:hypothetical protein